MIRTWFRILRAVHSEEVICAPEDPVSVVEPGAVFDLDAVDAGSRPIEGKDVQVAVIIFHLDEAVLVLE